MATGECNCGAVAFETDSNLNGIYYCHCTICRRATGANGIPVLLVDNAGFRWIRGEEGIRAWKKPDADWAMNFCATCGSPLPGPNDEKTMFVPAGLVTDQDEPFRVLHHIFVDSKAAWDEIGDSGKQHHEAFES